MEAVLRSVQGPLSGELNFRVSRLRTLPVLDAQRSSSPARKQHSEATLLACPVQLIVRRHVVTGRYVKLLNHLICTL
jgi:hypothetical protein